MKAKIDRPIGATIEACSDKRVPREPSPDQLKAGAEAYDENGLPVGNYVGNYALLRIYRAMIEASPDLDGMDRAGT